MLFTSIVLCLNRILALLEATVEIGFRSLESFHDILFQPNQEDNSIVQNREMATGVANDDGNGRQLRRCSPRFLVIFWGFVIMLRIAIGFNHHSGQDNHHGSLDKGAYGGDFEAQRHWMELTIHLPIGDWYWYDLGYWGLDYPPLTAYVSWACGWASHYIVGKESVALFASRGIEDPVHKAFMRGTVLLLDLSVYGYAVWNAAYEANRNSLWTILITLCQPAILLIDHGHFQYNTVALGLSIAGFSAMVQPNFGTCVWGGFFFTLALNFKQMTLYYAPVVFFYLLGRCGANSQFSSFIRRISWLGGAVLFTFYVLWEPFGKYAPSNVSPTPTPLERILHVLRRIFPFERGLFEGKVANLWCALNTSPIKIRSRIPTDLQPLLALAGTVFLMLPSCGKVLKVGMKDPSSTTSVKQHWITLLWATTSCSLSFFLASFQVHEKSILLALAPCSLLFWQDPVFVEWFSFVCVWSLWPLIQVDRLQTPYWCMVLIFVSLMWFRRIEIGESQSETIFSRKSLVLRSIPTLCYICMIGLHLTQALVPAPPRLPDLYEVLWSVAGCGMFCFAWLVTIYKLYFAAVSSGSAVVKEKDD